MGGWIYYVDMGGQSRGRWGGFEAFFVQFRGGAKHFCTSQGLGCSLI